MSNFCFFFMITHIIAASFITQGIVNKNRGNIINLPTWKKAITNILDGILISFTLYFILTQKQEQTIALALAAVLLGLFVLGILISTLYRCLHQKRLKQKYELAMYMQLLPPVSSKTCYTLEFEYIKCAIITFYKVVLMFVILLYFGCIFEIFDLELWQPTIVIDWLYLKRYLIIVSVVTICCVIDNLLAIVINRESKKQYSPDMEFIYQKLEPQNNRF